MCYIAIHLKEDETIIYLIAVDENKRCLYCSFKLDKVTFSAYDPVQSLIEDGVSKMSCFHYKSV